MLYVLFILIHILVCTLLVFFILIQSNKGMGLSGAFGAVGAGENFFSSSGAFNLLVKITITLSVLFAISSLTLSYFPPPSARSSGSILENQAAVQPRSVSDVIQEKEMENTANSEALQAPVTNPGDTGSAPAEGGSGQP